MRYHLKERYDFRLNMFDWDYNMYVKTLAPYIHPREYKIWRNTGLAFEWRLTENKIPNRTFSSYIPGYHVSILCHRNSVFRKKKKARSLCVDFGAIFFNLLTFHSVLRSGKNPKLNSSSKRLTINLST